MQHANGGPELQTEWPALGLLWLPILSEVEHRWFCLEGLILEVCLPLVLGVGPSSLRLSQSDFLKHLRAQTMSERTLREKGGGGGEDLRPPSKPEERVPKRRERPTYSTSNVHAYWPLCHTAVPGVAGNTLSPCFSWVRIFYPMASSQRNFPASSSAAEAIWLFQHGSVYRLASVIRFPSGHLM